MKGLYVLGVIVVVVTSFPLFAKAIPLFKKLLFPPMNKEKRIEIVKGVLPDLVPVLAVEIVLDALNSPYAFVFSSVMFILWMCLIFPLYLSVFRKARHGVLKVLGIGMAWAIFFICIAIYIGNTS